MPAKKEKVIELKISPSRAYLATNCLEWQNIKSGSALLKKEGNQNSGIEKHAAIENDISIVKNWLPLGYENLEVYQELEVETEVKHKEFLLKIKGFIDAVIVDNDEKRIYVYDWKTGGSQVETLSDEQLILYAYAYCKTKVKRPEYLSIQLIYVNPDLNTSFTKNYNFTEIVSRVLDILDRIANRYRGKSYNVGEHCNYCPAKSACPELLKQLTLLTSPEVNGKPIEKFSEMQLDLIRIGEKIIEELKNRMKQYLIFNPDKSLHGYILADRRGVRTIRQDADLKIFAEKLGLPNPDELFEKKLISVKNLEDRGLDVKQVEDYIFQPISKVLKKTIRTKQ